MEQSARSTVQVVPHDAAIAAMEITMKQAQLRVVARALGIMLLASAATATAADKPREGLWRYTMKMDMGNIATPSISQAADRKSTSELQSLMRNSYAVLCLK